MNMRPQFVQLLRERAPSVLPEGAPEIGFDAGVGWFPLLHALVGALQLWNQSHENEPPVVAIQIKEKFGTLRFYVGAAPAAIHDLIHIAERASEEICEGCGAAGVLVEVGSWRRTLCQRCHKVAVWERAERTKAPSP